MLAILFIAQTSNENVNHYVFRNLRVISGGCLEFDKLDVARELADRIACFLAAKTKFFIDLL